MKYGEIIKRFDEINNEIVENGKAKDDHSDIIQAVYENWNYIVLPEKEEELK